MRNTRQKDAANNCVIIFLSSWTNAEEGVSSIIPPSDIFSSHKCQNKAKNYDLQFSLFFHIYCVMSWFSCVFRFHRIYVQRPPRTLRNRSPYASVGTYLQTAVQACKTIDIIHIFSVEFKILYRSVLLHFKLHFERKLFYLFFA